MILSAKVFWSATATWVAMLLLHIVTEFIAKFYASDDNGKPIMIIVTMIMLGSAIWYIWKV